MNSEKRDFNKDAATWDENPGRVKMAESVFQSLNNNFKFLKNMDVMDFGCGTGLLSVQILPFVNSVTCVDSSTGMLAVLNSKISALKLSGIYTQKVDIDNGGTLTGKYDVVISSMTMHHIKNPAPLFKQFQEILKPGGFLCIADLDPDNGKFHDDNTGVFHEGFDRDRMKSLLENAGFGKIIDFTAAEISKPDEIGKMNNFSVFLIIGKKL